ncbi:hypothetical protein QTO34_012664 [Cnephaeus nilssonii]|uniref:Uncharacterized protein n=1 Tax=Cnephaeus nilssonii TaxID=3371016 RepID=A0AA40HAN3_CNENI|nr:hypothetical protein QTO34_012664 [Eptesicus nilssonii]
MWGVQEAERKGEGERVRNIDERETSISCLLHTPYWGCARNQASDVLQFLFLLNPICTHTRLRTSPQGTICLYPISGPHLLRAKGQNVYISVVFTTTTPRPPRRMGLGMV